MKALITGITGQDGAYLAELLLNKGYEVFGAYRRNAEVNLNGLKYLGIEKDVQLVCMDLLEFSNIQKTIKKIKPDEIYNLAAQSFVKTSFDQPLLTNDINYLGVLRLLESIDQDTKLYQASTSEMFGQVQETPQSEETPFYPRSPYGIAKLAAYWACRNYREAYNFQTYNGILFNHESPLRGSEFVTQKIIKGVKGIINRSQEKLTLGNLDAKRDWGYAKDYVEAMYLMMQDKPDDYVIATGKTYTVREFVEKAFNCYHDGIIWEGKGLNEKGYLLGEPVVEVSKEFYRPCEVNALIGDPSKAYNKLGWKSKTSLDELIQEMSRGI